MKNIACNHCGDLRGLVGGPERAGLEPRREHRHALLLDLGSLVLSGGRLPHLPLDALAELGGEVGREHDPVFPDVDDGRDLLLEHVGRDAPGEGVVDRGEVVEDEAQAALELLPEFPGHGQGGGGVVQDVADQVEARELPWHGSTVND